jgi:hypothetical protein
MSKADTVQSQDQVKQTITIDLSPPTFCEVKVEAESGIFKNGVQYDQGDTAVLESRAAARFEENGDVKIVKDNVPAPGTEVPDDEE